MQQYYSQDGQDRVLNEGIFHFKKGGVFVDIGANDGIALSNTYYFEKELGWTGICVEPLEKRYAELKENRPNSICIQACVYDKDTTVDFLHVDQIRQGIEMLSGIVDSMDEMHLKRIERETKVYSTARNDMIKVTSYTLKTLLTNHNITRIDYLSIDTEGSEKQVLEGIDFSKVFIGVIEVEMNYVNKGVQDIHALLSRQGYKLWKKVGQDAIYVHPYYQTTSLKENSPPSPPKLKHILVCGYKPSYYDNGTFLKEVSFLLRFLIGTEVTVTYLEKELDKSKEDEDLVIDLKKPDLIIQGCYTDTFTFVTNLIPLGSKIPRIALLGENINNHNWWKCLLHFYEDSDLPTLVFHTNAYVSPLILTLLNGRENFNLTFYPEALWNSNNRDYKAINKEFLEASKDRHLRKKFCCTVVSYPECDARNTFIQQLDSTKRVDSAGKHLNNMKDGWTVPGDYTSQDLINFMKGKNVS